jgi:hypothetical protein
MNNLVSEVITGKGSSFSFARFCDRWIWTLMALLLLSIVLLGFVPSSIDKVQAIKAGQRDAFPWFLHIHAVAMGSWVVLLLAQTLLVALNKRQWHKSLGMLSTVLAPLIFTMMVLIVGKFLIELSYLPPDAIIANVSGSVAFVLTLQGRAIVLYAIFFVWAYRTGRHNLETHKPINP